MRHLAPAQQRLLTDIQRLLSTLLLRDVADPRLFNISITRVESPGRQTVDVWVYRANEEDSGSVLHALERITPHFEHELRRALPKRRLPRLRFKWDKAFEKSGDVLMLLKKLESEQ
ncbi:ribosome-binding factor A [Mariprofundus ferrinatatus]|uniref:Ribosome-binding factor A n=1 Tax=Mariprofundus ferrinatatus TaxID=1921087 RepID=A0A2K8L6P1_9PROT|nr:ribosome-binding factor A [Mariprofundus ferrinatatus]ATX81919.1 ribosome-binding factor A [Mariprofundus ferrinatatus]